MQSLFTRAVLDPDRPVPAGLVTHATAVPVKRFAVYRNNVVMGLVNVLSVRFPAIRSLIGEESFRAVALAFVRVRPPTSPMMMFYGDEFPEFLDEFEPLRPVPYLRDVARLEAARTRAYHARDARPLGAEELSAVPGDELEGLRIVPHPSAEVLRSVHPVVTIWAMNAGERELAKIDDWRGEDALVVRPQLDVHVHVLPPGGAAFLQSLFVGSTLAVAAEKAYGEHAGFELTANLLGLVSSGVLTGLVTPNTEVEQ